MAAANMHNNTGCRITLIELTVLATALALGFAYDRVFGRMIDFDQDHAWPSYWPWVRWVTFLHAPAVAAAPAMCVVDRLFAACRMRPTQFSVLAWIWFTNALLWISIFTPGIGIFIALVLFLAQPAITLVGIVLGVVSLAAPEVRSRLSWIDALAVLCLVIFALNGMMIGESISRI